MSFTNSNNYDWMKANQQSQQAKANNLAALTGTDSITSIGTAVPVPFGTADYYNAVAPGIIQQLANDPLWNSGPTIIDETIWNKHLELLRRPEFNTNVRAQETQPVFERATVEEIHAEFMSASDRLLDEAQKTLERAEAPAIKKAERLAKFGFAQCGQVTAARGVIAAKDAAKANAKLVKEYRKMCPNYKFISEDQVKTICKKYGLVMGDINRFRGFVPEKNLADMEMFCRTHISEPHTFNICAPVKDMDTSGMYLADGYKLAPNPDPVILCRLKGNEGYLIVTAWGDEASDPDVVNENHN